MRANHFLDPVIREVANKYGLTFQQVQECMAAQYEFVRINIETYDPVNQEGSDVIYVPRFGKFLITDSKKEVMRERYNTNNKEEDETI